MEAVKESATASPLVAGFAQRDGAAHDPRLHWFRVARFGLFVHWGLYSVLAGRWHGRRTPNDGEWIMHDLRIPAAQYRAVAADFAPSHFDADELAELAVRTGQRYLVLTAKHHDGFCLWNSALTDFSTVSATSFGRDVVAEVAAACRRRNLTFGLYYSQTQDWTHPHGSGNDWDHEYSADGFETYLREYVQPQLTELLTGYGRVGLIWFDTPQHMSERQSRALVEHVHQLQPDCLVNGRVGNGLGDYGQTRDNGMADDAVGDWETPVTGNGTWGFMSDDVDWKPAGELIRTLAEVAGKGGNLLLNVGPDGDGRVPSAQVDRFRAVGEWLAGHGEAIYGTRAGRCRGTDWWSTETDTTLYLLVAAWPADRTLHVPGPIEVRSGRLLSDEEAGVQVTAAADGGIRVHVPDREQVDLVDVIALEIGTTHGG